MIYEIHGSKRREREREGEKKKTIPLIVELLQKLTSKHYFLHAYEIHGSYLDYWVARQQ